MAAHNLSGAARDLAAEADGKTFPGDKGRAFSNQLPYPDLPQADLTWQIRRPAETPPRSGLRVESA
ncbi:hypothetical protein GCM10025785_00140 [Corynebacterium canis]